MQLKDIATGELYTIIEGKILTKEEVLKYDTTASFITAVSGDVEIGVVFGYTKDGDHSPNNKFEVVSE